MVDDLGSDVTIPEQTAELDTADTAEGESRIQRIRTSRKTEAELKALVRQLAVDLDRIPIYDEVLFACIQVAELHHPLLVEYLRERRS